MEKLLCPSMMCAQFGNLEKEVKDLEEVFKAIEQQETKHAYILATYTAMLEFRELLAERQVVRKEMN